ncbi:tetratricopeptide repeat protein [Pseudovibrio sp. Tun.PSC04-5.I4]|uniref:NfrA family protein n=1 Tax=Pseudovibrio sp. Tun.PSC04-5.I4 TaxID=1798213 RepID=UPI000883900A|nr:tetratricopeptide repeat protein [Pseudovibrio sp. Tun.PSC04-5.I4]SDR03125.1 Tfp pilus assembly protein PilF [Pseudovibrio sp. Tun.PSC04-5.I4]
MSAPFRNRRLIRKTANRKAGFQLLWAVMFALGLSIPTLSQNPQDSEGDTEPTYTSQQKADYYISVLRDRQDSQSLLRSTWRDYRSYPLLDLTYRLLAEGRTEEALKELDQLLDYDPDHLIARWQKIHLLINLNRIMAAIDQLEILQSQAPAFSRGYLALGNLHMLAGDNVQAFNDFRLAIETGKLLESDREQALAGAAEAALKLGKTEEALNSLNILRELGRATPRQRLIRADLLRNLNQLEEAKAEWEALSKLDNAPQTQRSAILNQAFLLLERGDDAQAYELLLKGEKSGLFKGRQASALEQRTFARALAASALNSDHLNELLAFLETGRIDFLGLSSRVQLAYALLKKGSSAEAEMALLTSDGRLLDTKSSGPEEAANYYLSLADIAIRAGDDARAVTAGRLLIKLTRSPEYGLQLSNLALNNGWESAAIGALVELRAITEIADQRNSPEAWVELLQALSDLARRAGDLDLANEVLKEAEVLMPNWRITAKRGQVALLSNKRRVAAAVLNDALARANKSRETKEFNENDKKTYARLLFDLAAVSAANEDWDNALDFLIADWKVEPDPTLILPAYLILKESTSKDVTPQRWLNYVFAHTNTASLSKESKQMFAAAFLSLARVLKASGDLSNASKMYSQTLKLNGTSAARLEAAYLALQLRHPERALMLIMKMDRSRYQGPIMAIECEAYRALGRNQDALQCAQAEEKASPQDPGRHLALANIYLKLGEKRKALAGLEHAYELTPDVTTASQLGFLYQQLGNHPNALKWFSVAFEKHRNQQAGLALLFIYLQKRQYAEAAIILRTLNFNALTSKQKAQYYAARAQITLQTGQQTPEKLERALTDMRKARALDSTADIRFSIVQLLFQLGNLEEASAEYENLSHSDKQHAATLALGGYLARAQGDNDLAITRYEASLEIKPEQASLQEDLAYTYLTAFENKKAAAVFRNRIEVLQRQQLNIYEQDKLERFQRQLRILEIPISFLLFDGISPSRQDEEDDIAGAILGIPSSSPFGSVEMAWRPPVIGYQNGRTFEVIARAQWLNERYSFRPNQDTFQTIIGLRWKPLMTQNLKIGLERFFKGGSITEDNWLGRVLWSHTTGNDFLPLFDRETGELIDREPYVSLYLEGGRFFEKEKTILFYGDGRLGYTFRLDPNLILSPFAYSIGSGNWNSQTSAMAIEAGLGASLKWRGVYTEAYGDLLLLEVFGRIGHEVLNTNDSETSRVLLGLQANF